MKENVWTALYPEGISCASCGRDVFDNLPFCPSCAKKLTKNDGKFCERCGMPTVGEERFCIRCAENVNYFERAYSVYLYDEGTKPLLRRFKENGERWLGRVFAGQLLDYMREYDIEADVLTFVPMTLKKRRQRGYNQAEVFAEKLAEEMELPMNARLIRRVKKTKRQKELGPAERRKNLEGAFALAKPGQMKYCRILLVDDIYTTGSTVDAIASLLKVNGAEQVDFVCAAIVK